MDTRVIWNQISHVNRLETKQIFAIEALLHNIMSPRHNTKAIYARRRRKTDQYFECWLYENDAVQTTSCKIRGVFAACLCSKGHVRDIAQYLKLTKVDHRIFTVN